MLRKIMTENNHPSLTIYQFIHYLKTLPPEEADQFFQDVLKDSPIFREIIVSIYAINYHQTSIPPDYLKRLFQFIKTDREEFRRLVENVHEFLAFISYFPDQAKSFIEYVLAYPDEFQRLFYNVYGTSSFLSGVTEDEALVVVQHICENPNEWQRLFSEYEFRYALTHFPGFCAELLWNYLLENKDEIHRLVTPSFLMNIVSEKPEWYAKQILSLCPPQLIANTIRNAIENQIELIPIFLQFGIDPSLIEYRDKSLFATLLSKACLTPKYIDVCLSLIQHGAESVGVRQGMTFLTLLHQNYPDIKKFFVSHGVPEDKLNNSEYIFTHINIADLRLELASLNSVFKARRGFMYLCYMLANDRINHASQSYFRVLPLDMLLYVAQFFNYKNMGKTQAEGLALARHIMVNAPQIKNLAGTPGGLNVWQFEGNKPTFTFFKSPRTLAKDFEKQKCHLENDLKDQRPMRGKLSKKAYTEKELDKLNQLREYALPYYKEQLLLFKRPEAQMILKEQLKETELYYPLESKL